MTNQGLTNQGSTTHRISNFLRFATVVSVAAVLLMTSACRIEKDKNGNDGDNVKISTPFGGLKVRSNETDAAAMGLPAYPGAHVITKKNDGDDGSVDLHMGFGPWQLHVQVASYGTTDPQDKVVAFYRQALGKYGTVIECSSDTPIGTPTQTTEGLTCADDVKEGSSNWSHNSGININDLHLELKTGSRHHQHIVGFKQKEGETRFALIALDLPNTDKEDQTN
jgi:hypothetical protein